MKSEGILSKSGVFIYEKFQDNLILDRYDPIFQSMRHSKLNAMRSENSEDVITWNVFRTLQKMNPEIWVQKLFNEAFKDITEESTDNINISLWDKIKAPPELSVSEGDSEIDVIIETESFCWFIEAKYKSDISLRTSNDPLRNQILRNIDVGSHKYRNKNFYFSLLLLGGKFSPKGTDLIDTYQKDFYAIPNLFPHRNDRIQNLKGLSILKWEHFIDLFSFCEENTKYEDEMFLASRAREDLERRINKWKIN